jgi:hypothetical protein
VRLVGCLQKYITMHGPTNVKYSYTAYLNMAVFIADAENYHHHHHHHHQYEYYHYFYKA